MCILSVDTLAKAATLVNQVIWVYDLSDGSFWHNRGLSFDDWRADLLATGDWEIIERSLDSWRHVDLTSEYPMEFCINERWVSLCCQPVTDSGRTVGVIGVETDVTAHRSVLPRLHEIRSNLSRSYHRGVVAA